MLLITFQAGIMNLSLIDTNPQIAIIIFIGHVMQV